MMHLFHMNLSSCAICSRCDIWWYIIYMYTWYYMILYTCDTHLHAAWNFQRWSLQSTMFCWMLGLGDWRRPLADGFSIETFRGAILWKGYLKICKLRPCTLMSWIAILQLQSDRSTEPLTAVLIVIAKCDGLYFGKLPILPPSHFRIDTRSWPTM